MSPLIPPFSGKRKNCALNGSSLSAADTALLFTAIVIPKKQKTVINKENFFTMLNVSFSEKGLVMGRKLYDYVLFTFVILFFDILVQILYNNF